MYGNGLQLCDNWESSKYGAAQCNELGGGCQGSSNTNCNPHVTWGSKASSGEPSSGHLNQSNFGNTTNYPIAWAFGVRCVLDLILHTYYKVMCYS